MDGKLKRLLVHLNKMLTVQGYTERCQIDMAVLAKIGKTSERNKLSFIASKGGSNPVIVYFADVVGKSSLGSAEVKSLGELMSPQYLDIQNAMIISKIPLSTQAKTLIEGLRIRVWSDIELLYDPTESVYSSSVRNPSLTSDAMDGVRPGLCPRMETTDIIARYYDISPGALILFDRDVMIPMDILEKEQYIRLAVSSRLGKSR